MTAYNPLEGERPHLVFKVGDQPSDERISIIVVHNDHPEYLAITVQTIAVLSQNYNYELIVVDNGSTHPNSRKFLDQIEADGVKVIRNSENLYWSKAANQGAKAASKHSKYLVFMHHDVCVVNPVWLDMLINISQAHKSGLVGVSLKKYERQQEVFSFVEESCMLVTRECWEDAGPFAEELPQEGAPYLFNLKASQQGYNPQALSQRETPCVFHFRVFAIDYNEYERIAESAQKTINRLLVDMQKKV